MSGEYNCPRCGADLSQLIKQYAPSSSLSICIYCGGCKCYQLIKRTLQ